MKCADFEVLSDAFARDLGRAMKAIGYGENCFERLEREKYKKRHVFPVCV